ncbi:cytochrome b/b6 domain-containing protein [Vibrio sp.]|uniref:cytochrome b/b6 domain-containing protein n=1 Tax=Vibrio sp. TaxID=678 RepID=UPI003AA7BA92
MKVMIYKRFERFWHWGQAALMFAMLITGFEIHGTYQLLGFSTAVLWHEYCAFALMTLWVFAIFWHFTTGEWRHYIPTTEKLVAVLRFYSKGIFQGEPHPFKSTIERKHNPLQVFAYLGFKLIMGPLIWVTGLLLLFYAEWERFGLEGLSLAVVATLHIIGAFFIAIFFIGHIYMTTTGSTPLAHIRTMITGYEQEEEAKKENV